MHPHLSYLLRELRRKKRQYTTTHAIDYTQHDMQAHTDGNRTRRSLWRHPDFLRLWTGETISLFGTQVTVLALPTLAILTFHADPFSVGVLVSLQWLPFLFLGPLAGVIVDRLPRRQIMIVADLGRLVALGSLPVAFALGMRTMVHLYIIAAVVSSFTVFFDVSYQSYLPVLVNRTALAEGNAKLTLGKGAAQIGGPALGGLLMQWVGAATAITANACSYLASALFLVSIRKWEPEPAPSPQGRIRGVFAEMREGIEMVFHHPLLRTIALVNTVQNFGTSVAEAVVLIFAYRSLHLSPGLVGTAMAVGSVGFVLGALVTSPVTRKLGVGPTLGISSMVGALSYLVIPLGLFGMPALVVALWRLLFGLHIPTYDINQVSLRQAITPDRLHGRMNATIRTISYGALGVGPLVGGFLGTQLGLVPTIVLGGIIYVVATLLILTKSMISLKEHLAPAAP